MHIENVQIYTSTKRLVPNFKLAKVTQNLTADNFQEIVI